MSALQRVVDAGAGVVLVTHDERVARLTDARWSSSRVPCRNLAAPLDRRQG